MTYAAGQGQRGSATWAPVPAVVFYTDSETWFGNVHPAKALLRYREG